MLMLSAGAWAERKQVTVTNSDGERTITAVFEYGTSGLDLEEVNSFDHGDPKDEQHPVGRNTKVIRYRTNGYIDMEFMLGISIVSVNGRQESYLENSHNGVQTHVYYSLNKRLKRYKGDLEWSDELPYQYKPLPISWQPVDIDEDEAEESKGTIYYYMYASATDYKNPNLKADIKVIIEVELGGGRGRQ